MTYAALAGAVVVIGLANYLWNSRASSPAEPAAAVANARTAPPPLPVPLTAADVKRSEILAHAAGSPGDPELGREYQEINAQYFRGVLPDIPVIWEAELTDVGPLLAPGFVLDGLSDSTRILLNVSLKLDARRLRAVLCHEMVHEYFFSAGGPNPKHGPAFQEILRRLADEGAFEGVSATAAEKAALRSQIDTDAARLNDENAELENNRGRIVQERGERDREMNDLNERIRAANGKGSGWPSREEIAAVEARGRAFADRLAAFNAQVAKVGADVEAFNREAERFNLMMSFPDGLDEESLVGAKFTKGP